MFWFENLLLLAMRKKIIKMLKLILQRVQHLLKIPIAILALEGSVVAEENVSTGKYWQWRPFHCWWKAYWYENTQHLGIVRKLEANSYPDVRSHYYYQLQWHQLTIMADHQLNWISMVSHVVFSLGYWTKKGLFIYKFVGVWLIFFLSFIFISILAIFIFIFLWNKWFERE